MKILHSKPTLLAVLFAVGLTTALNAHADDEARKAILELRVQLKATVQTVQEQQNQITQLNEALAKLRGQHDVTANTVGQLKADQSATYDSVDKRLVALEPIPIEVQTQTSYDAAALLLENKDYAAALKAFDAHAKKFPQSAQMADVRYSQGFAAFALNNQKLAVQHLTRFTEQYATHAKMPDALFVLGNAQLTLNKKPDASATFKKLIAAFPEHANSQKAALLLK